MSDADLPDDPSGGRAHHDAVSDAEAEAEAWAPDLDLGIEHGHLHIGADRATAPTDGGGPPVNPLAGRQRILVIYLRVALAVVFVVGVIELFIPESARDRAGVVMVGCLVVAPLGRVVWLVVRWIGKGDWRFAITGVVLLGIVATGLFVR